MPVTALLLLQRVVTAGMIEGLIFETSVIDCFNNVKVKSEILFSALFPTAVLTVTQPAVHH